MSNNQKEKFRVWKREKEIIVAKFWGKQDEKDAKGFIVEVYKLTVPEEIKRKTDFLVDKFLKESGEQSIKDFIQELSNFKTSPVEEIRLLIDATEADIASAGARKTYLEFAKAFRMAKAAIFGTKTLLKVLANFIIATAAKENVKFFSTEEEALEWLKGE